MDLDGTVKKLLRRDQWVAAALLVAVIAASWAYLLAGAGMGMSALDMTRMNGTTAPMGDMGLIVTWSAGYALVSFVMWWSMMIAMMLPSAAPMILLFAVIQTRQHRAGNRHVPTTIFTLGYMLAWAGFSLGATAMHWTLARAGLLTPAMALTGQWLGAGLLLAAGFYQLTPIKRTCLRHCRLPAMYLASHWRPGKRGALIMGLGHGAYCLGCCWFLMLLLFFGGVMNLYWIAGLALLVLLEKTLPLGHWLGYGVGLLLIAGGVWLLLPVP
ncbi:DUF2182 domain-containing protein [Halomonas sp. NO4]|uniref:DUF2182 domain-containing protein n=1 Tax=Halomonas sp. NO4 TaxID=2484813 RepID=UPI0013D22B41|nr:DUF2182 domain-containing protein [Halomonas sp. NO4]